MSPENPRVALAREALRLHQRYQRELVERFSVCPWAKPARSADRIRAHVVVEPRPAAHALAPIVDAWASDAQAEVAFVIAPRFSGGIDAFDRWTAEVGKLRGDVFLGAPFRPEAPPTAGAIHFLRQTPDPTVQLVRRTRLEEIRAQDPPHYTDIFDLDMRELEGGKGPRTVAASVLAYNERMLEREGRARLQAIVDDIRADRERSYAGLV